MASTGSIVLASLLVGAAILLLVWFIVRSGREVARVTVKSGEPFRLTAELDKEQVVTLWCDVDLGFDGELSLSGPLRVDVNGRTAWNDTFSLGPMGTTTPTAMSKVKKVWIRSFSGVRGQARIAKIVVPQEGEGGDTPYRTPGATHTQVVAEGTIEAGPGIEVRKLELFLGAR